MDTEITNIYNDTTYVKVMNKALKRYQGLFSVDEIRRIKLMAIWRALKGHDNSFKSKFSSSLYRFVVYECKTILREELNWKRWHFKPLEDQAVNFEESPLEYLDGLSTDEQGFIVDKFLQGLTYKEIGAKHGHSTNTARVKTMKAISKIKEGV